ncbi:AraC family transcriptional regulator [bacterium]|nr:AraC family transcriptional regulator [bacterium]
MNNIGTTRAEYISRINKTFDYIDSHLDSPITLEELAAVASFSKYHFNRIFHSIVHETPFRFIQRVRIEKAAMLILTNRKMTISEIAIKCGFPDISVFSRNFKSYFGVSATQYRVIKSQNSNLNQAESKTHQAEGKVIPYFCPELQTIKWRTNMKLNKNVEITELPGMTLAYIRHIGPYQGDGKLFERLWNRLFAWAGPRGLVGGKDFRSLVIYHDDPNLTEGDKLRMSVCITDRRKPGLTGKSARWNLKRQSMSLPVSRSMNSSSRRPGTGSTENGSQQAAISLTRSPASRCTRKNQRMANLLLTSAFP